MHVGIVTRTDDFHAYVIRQALVSRGERCSIIPSDELATSGGMSWSTTGDAPPSIVTDVDGTSVLVHDLDVLWWRRVAGAAQLPDTVTDEAARDVVAKDGRATLLGMMLTDFGGTWISDPEATRTAQNKLLQLRVAQHVGLRVPRTLVSQDPEAVRNFCAELDYQVVVKTVAGTQLTPLMTGRVSPELIASDAAIRLSPAIYQQMVPGRRHLRVCSFGSEVITAVLESDRLDWRYPPDAHAELYTLDEDTADQVRQVVAALGLRMGIIDIKLGPDGEPVWLEINPQGQFLFLEGMCGMPLTAAFTDFLEREAQAGPVGRSDPPPSRPRVPTRA